MTYNHKIRGPDLATAWAVLEGAVVIVGIDDTVTFPAGSTWPGLSALPATLAEHLAPQDTQRLAGTRVVPWQVTPRETEFAAALIQVQLMRSRRQSLPDRVNLLRAVADLSSDNRETVATALGLSRHAFRGETLHLFQPRP